MQQSMAALTQDPGLAHKFSQRLRSQLPEGLFCLSAMFCKRTTLLRVPKPPNTPPLFIFCFPTLVPGNSLSIFMPPQLTHCPLSTPSHTVLGASLLLPPYLDMSTSKLLRPRAQPIAPGNAERIGLSSQSLSQSAPGCEADRSLLPSESNKP